MSVKTCKSEKASFEKICRLSFSRMKAGGVPGAAIGLVRGDSEAFATFGTVNIENPLPVDGDTLFKIASISKTFLATVAVMLAERGVLDLSAPVRKYLPGLKLSDREVQKNVTMIHLLTHTAGWYGDYFDDFGRGDDALAKMVEKMAELPQIARLGEIFSYSNSSFNLAARVIEVITGKTYESAIAEMLLKPLGMKNSFFFAEDVIVHRFAIGHSRVNGKLVVAKPWGRARCASPTGGIICSIKDLLRYARFQMGDGMAPNGKRLLSKKSIRILQEPVVDAFGGKRVALSWFCEQAGDSKIILHGGGTMGQSCELRIAPAEKLALAILTNSGEGTPFKEIFDTAFHEYLDYTPSVVEALRSSKEVLREYVGRYINPASICKIRLEKSGLRLYMTHTGGFPTPKDLPKDQPKPCRVALCAKDKLIYLEGPLKGSTGDFIRGAGGKIGWLRFSRAMKKE